MTDEPTIMILTCYGPVDVPPFVAAAWEKYGYPDNEQVRALAKERAARLLAEDKRTNPLWQRDFDRTECAPDCKKPNEFARVRHTHTLGFCAEASRPDSDPETVVDLAAHLKYECGEAEYGDGLAGDPTDIADQALLWLRGHSEVIPRIWPDRATGA